MQWIIPYLGQDYEFDDSRITASEARVQKRITDGLTPLEAERKRYQLDGEAWEAALVIARRRGGLEQKDAEEIDRDELELMAIQAATEKRLRETREAQEAADDKAKDEPLEAEAETDPVEPLPAAEPVAIP